MFGYFLQFKFISIQDKYYVGEALVKTLELHMPWASNDGNNILSETF